MVKLGFFVASHISDRKCIFKLSYKVCDCCVNLYNINVLQKLTLKPFFFFFYFLSNFFNKDFFNEDLLLKYSKRKLGT